MSTLTIPTWISTYFDRSNYKFKYNDNEYGAESSVITISNITSSSPKIFTFVANDGYSFNPNNEETPQVTPAGIDLVYKLRSSDTASKHYYLQGSTVTYNTDYTECYIDFSNLSGNSVFYTYNCEFRIGQSSIKATIDTTQTTKYTVTNNLTGVTADSNNLTEIEENTNFSLIYNANTHYKITNVTCNIGEYILSNNDTTVTITGTATENITVTITAQETEYTITNNLTNVIASSTNVTNVYHNSNFLLYYDVTDKDLYTITSATVNIGTATIASDGKSASVTGTATENIIVTIIATKTGLETFTITENLTNIISVSENPTSVTENENFTLNYIANTDDINSEYYYIDTLTSNIGTVTISADKRSATVTGTATENIIINGSASKSSEPTPTYYTVTANITNVTADATNPTTVTENTSFTLKYTANSGYEITTANSNIGTVTISDDKSTVTITGTATENIVVTISATSTTPSGYTYTITGLVNCTCNKQTGDTVSSGDVITITANTGYQFAENQTSYEIIGVIVDYFDISTDKLTLTYTVETAENLKVENIIATLIPSVTTSQFLRIYEPTDNDLNNLSKQRYTVLEDGNIIDYGNNIIQLYRCYVPISDGIKSTGTIILGLLNTNIQTTQIADNIINVNTSITIENLEYNNSYTALLYIPNNNNPIQVPLEHIFNKTLDIKLSYELYSNKCNYSLFDDSTMFDCGVFQFGSNIPFRFYEANVLTEYNYNPPLFKHCYLIITGEKTVKINDITTDYFNGTILDIDRTNIPDEDFTELETILTQGVYK